MQALTVQSLSEASDELSSQLDAMGWGRAISDDNRKQLVDSLIVYLVTARSKLAIDQFVTGLKNFGVSRHCILGNCFDVWPFFFFWFSEWFGGVSG